MAQLEGTPVLIGSRTFIVPECTMKTAKRMRKLLRDGQASLAAIADGATESSELLEEFGSIVMLELLRRNYPELTVDELDDEIPVTQVDRVFAAVLRAAGFEAAVPGEAQRPEGSTGATSTSGTISTGESSAGPAAGVGPTSTP